MKIIKALRDGLTFSLFPKKLVRFFYKPYSFAWLVHSRNIQDFYNRFPITKILPAKLVLYISMTLWPFVVSDITGVTDKNGKTKLGCIIGVPLLPEQILKNRKLTEKRIIQAIKLCEKIGIKNMALGGYNSVITDGGKTVYDKTSISLTNSYALLSGVALRTIEKILELHNRDFSIKFGIVGATTIPGRAFTKLLIKKRAKNILLVGKTLEHLEELKNECKQLDANATIEITLEIKNIKECDFVVIAVNNPSIVISPQDIKKNSIVFDITQPINPSTINLEQRKDIFVGHGLAVTTPGIDYHFDFGIPQEEAFPCLAEVILLVKEQEKKHFGIGNINLSQIEEIVSLAEKYDFNPILFKKPITWK
jgi:predicted amino acid dehydrogenase